MISCGILGVGTTLVFTKVRHLVFGRRVGFEGGWNLKPGAIFVWRSRCQTTGHHNRIESGRPRVGLELGLKPGAERVKSVVTGDGSPSVCLGYHAHAWVRFHIE